MSYDAIIIGGGFYGTAIAIYLAERRGFSKIALVEQEQELFARASYRNQARIHAGAHYPRSLATAFRSQMSFPRFVKNYHEAIERDFTSLYAISRRNSKTTKDQFIRFCAAARIPLKAPPPQMRALFDERLIADVFLVEEYVFDATKLAALANEALARAGIEVKTGMRIDQVEQGRGQSLLAKCAAPQSSEFSADYIFNCTYSGLDQIKGITPLQPRGLRHEIAEIALIKAPAPLDKFCVTVMDGPFFSLTPFPARGLHALTHVRWTPHLHWLDDPAIDPYEKLAHYPCQSRAERMIRDARRYLPMIAQGEYVSSLFEVKTVLARNERDDGRPILFEKNHLLPNYYSILGGKIDNIYDIWEKLDAQPLPLNDRAKGQSKRQKTL